MNSVWSSRADVLNDLKEVSGGNPGISDLDDFVAVGERPPPDRRESIDENELQDQFGVLGNGPVGSTAPDLHGISQMLQLVNEDPYIDNEPKTVFRNTMTDEINISKLNPNVIEFVPSSVRRLQPQKKQETLKKSKLKSPKKLDQSTSKVNTEIKVSSENKICDTEKKDEAKTKTPMNLLIAESNSCTINESGKHKQKSMNLESTASESMNSVSKATGSSNVISLEKKVDISNMKSEEIEEVKMKIKSKIIDSSGDSIKQKKERNVAIAALLRLNATAPAVPAEKPVKLITPDYFKTLPTEEKTDTEKESDVKDTNETVEELEEPATSTSSKPVVYKDPFVEESIAKVNSWFDNEDSPKVPKMKPLPVQPPAAAPVPLPPVQFKDVLSFKKKNASSLSINSRKSETNSEKKKQFTAFVPSSYANDLLQKYEKNAKTQVAPRVDWGEALERRLMEKDKEIKKKMRDAQDGASPNSVGGNGNSA